MPCRHSSPRFQLLSPFTLRRLFLLTCIPILSNIPPRTLFNFPLFGGWGPSTPSLSASLTRFFIFSLPQYLCSMCFVRPVIHCFYFSLCIAIFQTLSIPTPLYAASRFSPTTTFQLKRQGRQISIRLDPSHSQLHWLPPCYGVLW